MFKICQEGTLEVTLGSSYLEEPESLTCSSLPPLAQDPQTAFITTSLWLPTKSSRDTFLSSVE